jgi:hypothetical protein
MLKTTPDKVRWIDTVLDCGRAFAAEGVVSGEGVYVCDAKDGAAVLMVAYPSPPAAVAAANNMMAFARVYTLDARSRAEGDAIEDA